ncbi:Crp/Fnr family transcriptional regulator [Sediminicola luteus]|nr:Crp/Fnr family transcriptional regulator [Sediminicola luteus]
MTPLIDYIKTYITLSPEAEQEIRRIGEQIEVPKGTVLLEEGKICRRMYFVAKGTLRTYFYQKGKDITYWIYLDGNLAIPWYSYIQREPSSEYLEAIEDAVLCSLTYDQWQELYLAYPELERFGRLTMEEATSHIDEFYKGYFLYTAKEKYELLTYVFPEVTQRANLGHIASMLGISQETLSRIRAGKA